MAQSVQCREELMAEQERLLARLLDTGFTASRSDRSCEERAVGFAFLAELWLQVCVCDDDDSIVLCLCVPSCRDLAPDHT